MKKFLIIAFFIAFAISNILEGKANGSSTLSDFWNGTAHFALNQNPAPVPHVGHREAFAVFREDISPSTIYLYHRCYPNICLAISDDNGASFRDTRVIITNSVGYFSVAPSVIKFNGTWIMVYEEGGSLQEGGGTWWAKSTDGITWYDKRRLFNDVYRSTPGLYQFQNTVYVFSAEELPPPNSGKFAIVFHSGPSMDQLVQWGGGYVLTGDGQPWSQGSVSMPRIIYDSGYHWMFYEGGTVNFSCNGENMYGWGLARSNTLTSWEKYNKNPIIQGRDSSSCGYDMPQPSKNFLTGEIFVYYTGDDTSNVFRDKLEFGSACEGWQTYPNWKELNHACMQSCGDIGGTMCFQTKNCQSGTKVGNCWDCVSCCR